MLPQVINRDTVFDRVRPVSMGREHSVRQDEGTVKAVKATLKEDTNSYSRVQRSYHSTRAQRESNIQDTRYKPYASTRNQHTEGRPRYNNERTWKEKKLPPLRINEIRAENRKELHQPESVPMTGKFQAVSESSSTSAMKLQSKVETIVKENNVTFRATNSRI